MPSSTAHLQAFPFDIPFRSITPTESDATNLLVTCCLSASHIAYGSIRLEPQLIMLGEAAGVASVMAIEAGRSAPGGLATPVQHIDVVALQHRLRALRPYAAILHEEDMVPDTGSTKC
jgi:hypothetical protein